MVIKSQCSSSLCTDSHRVDFFHENFATAGIACGSSGDVRGELGNVHPNTCTSASAESVKFYAVYLEGGAGNVQTDLESDFQESRELHTSTLDCDRKEFEVATIPEILLA